MFLFLIISFIIAGAGAWFHYFYKKTYKKVNIILAFLRFLAIFTLLLLLFNPQIETTVLHIEKPVLAVLVDNSSSVKKQEIAIQSLVENLKSSTGIQEKFEISFFKFGKDLETLDHLDFEEKETNIYTPLARLQEVYKNTPAAFLLISDGNQTVGNSVDFLSLNKPVFSVITGDTVHYNDLSIHKLNVNKYSYLKNNFPVEAFVHYSGENGCQTTVSVYKKNRIVYKESLIFKQGEHSKSIHFKLPSNTVGKQFYSLRVKEVKKEKNTKNNSRNFAVDVIDEQSKIAIITGVLHPDVGMLKRSIETNKQRKVTIVPIDRLKENLDSYDLLILYQPSAAFKSVFDKIKKSSLNYLIVTGAATDWQFLNANQSYFKKNLSRVKEEYLAVYNADYSVFLTEDLDFSRMPPLNDVFGKITISTSFETLLFQQIGTVATKEPLLFTFSPKEGQKAAVLLGDGCWKWRLFYYQREQSFLKFDLYIANLIQYVSSNSSKTRLTVTSKSFYNQNETIEITAFLNDHNFKFDPSAKLWLSMKSEHGTYQKNVPFALQDNSYSVVMNDVPVGMYRYTVNVDGQQVNKHGRFKVRDFDAEQVFDASNVVLMKNLAKKSNGQFYSIDASKNLVSHLVSNTSLKPIQKSVTTKNPLIQLRWLLGLIIALLSVEWLLRKYIGDL